MRHEDIGDRCTDRCRLVGLEVPHISHQKYLIASQTHLPRRAWSDCGVVVDVWFDESLNDRRRYESRSLFASFR